MKSKSSDKDNESLKWNSEKDKLMLDDSSSNNQNKEVNDMHENLKKSEKS